MEFQFERIESSSLPQELKCWIDERFAAHSEFSLPGFDEKDKENRFIVHEVFQNSNHNKNRMGCIVSQVVFHQLHIKYLMIDLNSRRHGLGRTLMQLAEESGRKSGCEFAYVETYSFQGPEFYQKCGYSIDFEREGFYASKSDERFSYFYLSKILQK